MKLVEAEDKKLWYVERIELMEICHSLEEAEKKRRELAEKEKDEEVVYKIETNF